MPTLPHANHPRRAAARDQPPKPEELPRPDALSGPGDPLLRPGGRPPSMPRLRITARRLAPKPCDWNRGAKVCRLPDVASALAAAAER